MWNISYSCTRPGVCDARLMNTTLCLLTLACLVSCQMNDDEASNGEPDTTKPAPVEISPTTPIDVMKHETLVGQTLVQVQAACDVEEVAHRVVEVDGEARPVTMDYRPERLNFKVKDGIVTVVTNG